MKNCDFILDKIGSEQLRDIRTVIVNEGRVDKLIPY